MGPYRPHIGALRADFKGPRKWGILVKMAKTPKSAKNAKNGVKGVRKKASWLQGHPGEKYKKSKTYKSDNTWLYEELGIYNSDPEKEKKINDELKSFLKSIGYVPARIKIKNEK